jgi:beta-phosphoglucomutase-like phosphatase (HAD superfamily)
MKDLLSANGDLICEFWQIKRQDAQAPQRAEMMQRLEATQAQYDAAEAAADDIELIATLGKALQTLQQESAKLPLSEEDYLTLSTRHAALLQRVEERCKQLKKAKDFVALEALGVHLEAVKALKLHAALSPAAKPTKPAAKTSFGGFFGLGAPKVLTTATQADLKNLRSDSTELCAECNRLCAQAGHAPQRAEMMQRLEDAQAQYDAAVSAFTDLPLVASLGEALHALQQESAQLPLSEEDYLTLADRHATLVQRVVQVCKALAQAKQFYSLAALGGKLKLLRALKLPSIPSVKGKQPQTTALLWVMMLTTLLPRSF